MIGPMRDFVGVDAGLGHVHPMVPLAQVRVVEATRCCGLSPPTLPLGDFGD